MFKDKVEEGLSSKKLRKVSADLGISTEELRRYQKNNGLSPLRIADNHYMISKLYPFLNGKDIAVLIGKSKKHSCEMIRDVKRK